MVEFIELTEKYIIYARQVVNLEKPNKGREWKNHSIAQQKATWLAINNINFRRASFRMLSEFAEIDQIYYGKIKVFEGVGFRS